MKYLVAFIVCACIFALGIVFQVFVIEGYFVNIIIFGIMYIVWGWIVKKFPNKKNKQEN